MHYRNKLTGEIRDYHETTEHAASSYGQPVLVDSETNEAADRWHLEIVTFHDDDGAMLKAREGRMSDVTKRTQMFTSEDVFIRG